MQQAMFVVKMTRLYFILEDDNTYMAPQVNGFVPKCSVSCQSNPPVPFFPKPNINLVLATLFSSLADDNFMDLTGPATCISCVC